MAAVQLNTLPATARDLAQRAMDWADPFWDAEAGLFRSPANELYEAGEMASRTHMVRETVWYALGCLLRDGADDRERASHAIASVLQYQFDAPDTPYHGTWYRSPNEPPPPANPVMWRDYDPNWRDFIGTALAVILIGYEPRLPDDLVANIDVALRRAIESTIVRDVPASYTNIALMTAFLLQYGAERFGVADWSTRSEQLATAILERFRVNNTFDEYNAPTYYGIDLYALALWRAYGGSALLREGGAEMEAALWRDIAQFYHAEMRNIAGPYDRSYGMDMRGYVSCLGIWIWLATGREHAPMPDTTQPMNHGWDFALAPLIALLGLQMPDDALPHFLAFQGERTVERVIVDEPHRVATAWMAKRAMIGAEDSGGTHRMNSQYHPGTIHWLIGENDLGWIRLLPSAPVDARAERETLFVTCSNHSSGELTIAFEIALPEGQKATFEPQCWTLPGLNVQVETALPDPEVIHEGDSVIVNYQSEDIAAGESIAVTLRIQTA